MNIPNYEEAIDQAARHAHAQRYKTNGPYVLKEYAGKDFMEESKQHARWVIEGFMAAMAKTAVEWRKEC